MSYGVKIELIGQSSVKKNQWKVRLKKLDYSGSVSYYNVPAASPFILKKDAADTVRGTSFQLAIRSLVDFELIDLYTCDTKEYLTELLNGDDEVVWSGFLLPEQYGEEYKPAPNIINFTAADGLGLLKNETFESISEGDYKTYLEIIDSCLKKNQLNLGYSISIDIRETRQTANRSVLNEIRYDAYTYKGKTCYEVIESILNQFNATITQNNSRWLILDGTKNAPIINYATGVLNTTTNRWHCAFESVGSSLPVVVLGQLGNVGTELYPIGSPLQMTLGISYKNLKISDEYGTKDMLPASTENDWTNDTTLPGWIPFGVASTVKKFASNNYFLSIDGATDSQLPFNHGVTATVQNIDATTEDINLSFEIGYVYGTNVYLTIIVTDGSAIWSLTNTGWTSGSHSILLDPITPSTALDPKFTKITKVGSGIPISGTLTVSFTLASHDSSIPGLMIASSTLLKNIVLMQLSNGLSQPIGEKRNITLNKSTNAATREINIQSGSCPIIDNSRHVYKNVAFLDASGVDIQVGEWETDDISSTALLDVLSNIYTSDNRRAKQILTGTIRGEIIDFASIVQVNYPYTRYFEFKEFSYDLIADAVSVTLSEILDYVETPYTSVTEPITSSSSSSSGSSSGGSGATMTLTKAAIEAVLTGEISSHSHPGGSVTKAAVEAVLTGDISTHTHAAYLTAITKAMVEAVLTGTISSHSHPGGSVTKAAVEAVLTGDISTHTHAAYLTAITKAMVEAVLTGNISTHTHTLSGYEPAITGGTAAQYWRGDKTWQTLNKAAVGLGSVDNTSDAGKPISTAQQTALDLKAPIANPIFTGVATSPEYDTKTLKLQNSAGTVKWTISVDASNNLQFLNASGVVCMTLSQSGYLSAKDEIESEASI